MPAASGNIQHTLRASQGSSLYQPVKICSASVNLAGHICSGYSTKVVLHQVALPYAGHILLLALCHICSFPWNAERFLSPAILAHM
jgi:hypothetical protein